jgi:hypothetical protein
MKLKITGSIVKGDEHEETDDEAPPQWEDQPAREDGHPH